MKVYKYRGIEFLKRDIKTLKNNQIFASSFEKLNDPFEGIFIDQVSSLVLFLGKKYNANGREVIDNLKEVTDYKSNLGIYSLSKCSMNELLWAHYSNSHKGFCIEYELNGLKEYFQTPQTVNELKVNYKYSPQKISLKDFKKQKLFFRKLFATKSKKWKYENEIRLIFDSFGYKEYHPSTLTGIYFGVEMEEEHKELLIESFTDFDVKFYEIYRESNSFKLKERLVHKNNRILKKNLSQFNYSILKHKEENTIENFYIWFKGINYNQELLEDFSEGFREKHAKKKKSNLFIFNGDSIIPLFQKNKLNGSEEKLYDKLLIGHSFSSDKGYSLIFYDENWRNSL